MPKHPSISFGFRSPEPSGGGPGSRAANSATRAPIFRYVTDGAPAPAPPGATVKDALEFGQSAANRMALVLYPTPDPEQISELRRSWDLHPVLAEDLDNAQQRPKLERYGDVLFLVVRSADYVDKREQVTLSEFHIVVRPGAVAIVCQDGRWIDGSSSAEIDGDHPFTSTLHDASLLGDINLLGLGPEAAVYRILDAIVDGYDPALRGLEIDKEEIERQVFSGDPSVAERIYRLSQEVIETQQTVSSMTSVLDDLKAGFEKYAIPRELQSYLDDVADHLAHAAAHVRDLRESLAQILSVHSTLVAQRQNDHMKKISAWAAILFAPSLIGSIYGMNFRFMPELEWAHGYPVALVMMLLLSAGLYLAFKKSNWM